MSQTVELLCEGWYGTIDKYPVGHPYFKKEVPCEGLIMNSLKLATSKFVPLCKGISGTIGSLVVDPNYKAEKVSLPIDTLVSTMTKEVDIDDDSSDSNTVVDGVASPLVI